ncbi:hypothetical protein [Simkania sp.]|uniref:hypothetical protein n=1 Tax=Simkania sp. TaxID=34094 RepID=UPI003B5272CF
MSLEVPGFGATARAIPADAWLELARRNQGVVQVGTLLRNLTQEYRFRLMRNPLADQQEIVIPRPLYPNEVKQLEQKHQEKVERVRKIRLNPNAPAFKPTGKSE